MPGTAVMIVHRGSLDAWVSTPGSHSLDRLDQHRDHRTSPSRDVSRAVRGVSPPLPSRGRRVSVMTPASILV
jgi:hypothetical protein